MIKKCVLFFLLLYNSSFLIAQEKTENRKIDSLFKTLSKVKVDTSRVGLLNEIGIEFLTLDPNKGIVYSNQALQLSKKIKWDDGIALSLRSIGQNYAVLGDIEKADKYFEQAFPFAESKLNKVLIYRAKGTIYNEKANYQKALECYFKALKIAEEIKDYTELARMYRAIGSTYVRIKNPKKALFYFNKSLGINMKLNLKEQVGRNMQNIGDLYFRGKNYPLAISYFSRALTIANKLDDKDGIAFLNLEISLILKEQEKFEESLKYLKVGKKIALEIKNYRYIANSKLDEAQLYLTQYQKDSTNFKKRLLLFKSETLLLESIQDFKESRDNINIGICLNTLAEVYLKTKKNKKAAIAALDYARITELIFNEKSKETVKNLEDQRTIDLKNKQIEINKINIENQEKQKWFYVAGIGFLFVLGGLFFFQSRNRKKTNKELQILNSDLDQANKTKIRFLSILNHDLRGPVYNFIHFMQLQKESPELLDEETKNEIETKTISTAENLLASMEDLLLWSKGQMDNFKPQPKTIDVQNLFDDTKNHFAGEERVQIIFENLDNLQIITDENFLKTIIRNLTGNAIKNLKEKPDATVIWKVYRVNNKINLSISDNGSGVNQDQLRALFDDTEVVGIKTGLGLHLIRDLAKAIDCEISVESRVGEGTTFVLKMKNS